jgi:hypothetical protein
MTGHEDTGEHEAPFAAEEWRSTQGGLVSGPELDSDHDHDAESSPQDAAEPTHWLRIAVTTVAVLAGLFVVFISAVTGFWYWRSGNASVVVPDLGGLTTGAASRALSAQRLTDGRGFYAVTRDFPAGLVTSQTPSPATLVSPGSPVDVDVAVVPSPISVRDVVFADASLAEQALAVDLLKPAILYAYSTDVEVGRVMEQLPRSGDTVMTGSQEVLVVSMGPGTGGKRVPTLTGLSLKSARSMIASATLYPQIRTVVAPGVSAGTVVDQAPAAGTVVPVATDVTVSIATTQ